MSTYIRIAGEILVWISGGLAIIKEIAVTKQQKAEVSK